jgi:hypothetical protein
MFFLQQLNTNKVEVSGIAAVHVTKQGDVTVKYITCFFKKMANHVARDTVFDGIPHFMLHHAKPGATGSTTNSISKAAIEPQKKKADKSPPGTPTHKKKAKKAHLKPTGGH